MITTIILLRFFFASQFTAIINWFEFIVLLRHSHSGRFIEQEEREPSHRDRFLAAAAAVAADTVASRLFSLFQEHSAQPEHLPARVAAAAAMAIFWAEWAWLCAAIAITL